MSFICFESPAEKSVSALADVHFIIFCNIISNIPDETFIVHHLYLSSAVVFQAN
jgi:hypothetical protein